MKPMNPWDARYDIDDYFYGTEPNDFLKEKASAIPARGRVLCLAEGEGRNAVYLASLGYDVTAVDGSKVGLEKLSRLAASRKVSVQTIVTDLGDFQIEPGRWDAIVSIWCHVPEALRGRLHRASVLGLKGRGVFILESYHPRQLTYKTGGPPTAELMLTAAKLKSELVGLEFELLQETDREIHEGAGHNGLSAVVQAFARKGV